MDDTFRNITPTPAATDVESGSDSTPDSMARAHHEYASIVADLPLGILGLDYDGNITLINEAARRYAGIPFGSAVGRSVADAIERTEALAPIQEAIERSRDGYPLVREYRCGDMIIELRSSVTADSQRLSNTTITLENVSWRREIASRKDEFLSLVSHELRTPLTVIRGYLDIFHRGMMGEQTPDQLDAIRLMLDQCTKLEGLIRDLVRFRNISRTASGASGEPLALGPATREAVAGLIDDIARAGMRLSIDVQEGNLSAWCSQEHFATVIRHLVDNSIKFAGAGCTVRVSAGEFQLENLPPIGRRVIKRDPPAHTRWAAVSVADDGPGIDPEIQVKAFETFQQGEPHLTRRKRGLGLGLPLVREIIDSAGGTLWLDDSAPRGTRVTFILPLIHGKSPDPTGTAEQLKEITQ